MADEGSSRPSMGFPLGLALLVVMLLCMSGFYSCFFHWDKFRALFQPSVDDDQTPQSQLETGHPYPPPKKPPKEEPTQGLNLTVVMPGDKLPKFIALPSPRDVKS